MAKLQNFRASMLAMGAVLAVVTPGVSRAAMMDFLSPLSDFAKGLGPYRTATVWSPWRVNGQLGYSYSQSFAGKQKPLHTSLYSANADITKGAKGFLWHPGFLTWSHDNTLGGDWSRNMSTNSNDDSKKRNEATMRYLEDGFEMTLLPKSNFPFQVKNQFQWDDSSEGAGRGPATYLNLTSFLQKYRSKEGDTQGALRLERMRSRAGGRDEVGILGMILPGIRDYSDETKKDTLELTASHRLDDHTVEAEGKVTKSVARAKRVRNTIRESNLLVEHDFEQSAWSVDNTLNAGRSRVDARTWPNEEDANGLSDFPESNRNTSHWQQLSSTVSWRATDTPLTLVATSRLYHTANTGTQGSEGILTRQPKNTSNTVNLGLSSQYRVTPSVSLSGRLSAQMRQTNAERTKGQINRTASQGTSLSYNPRSKNYGPYIYNWNGSLNYNTSYARDILPQQSGSESVSHSMSRVIPLSRKSQLSLALSEGLTSSQSSRARGDTSLSHSIDMKYSHEKDENRSYVSVTASDERTWNAEKRQTQLVNLQASRNGNFPGGLTWNGHTTMQWGSTRPLNGNTVISKSSSANLKLTKNNLFDVLGFNLTSSLMMSAPDTFVPLFKNGEAESRAFDSQLTYRIGKLTLSFSLNLNEDWDSETDSYSRNGMIFFEMRRVFNQTF